MSERAYRIWTLLLLGAAGAGLFVMVWRATEACRDATRNAADAAEACHTAVETNKPSSVNLPPACKPTEEGGRPTIRFNELESKYDVRGETGHPLGEILTLQGIVVNRPRKGAEFQSNIRVQRINGRATQDDIYIKLEDSQAILQNILPGASAVSLAIGKTYELQGFEKGVSTGFPYAAFGVVAAVTGLYLTVHFDVVKAKEIPEIRFGPADFLDRFATLEGTARTTDGKGYLVGSGWKLLVLEYGGWPQHMEGKDVEVDGIMRALPGSKDVFRLDNGKSRLVRLEDQLGREVELKGQARSLNFHWWFRYRGVDLYVEDMEKLPDWKADRHGETLLISGFLDEAMLPRIDQISLKEDRDLNKYFIVRKASWRPIQRLQAK